jgi:hypothetical protein
MIGLVYAVFNKFGLKVRGILPVARLHTKPQFSL